MVLATGLRKPVERTLGVTTQVQADAVLRALREDAAVLVEAMTVDQARELGLANTEKDGAVWAGTKEHEELVRKERRKERQEARERYRREWGREPGW